MVFCRRLSTTRQASAMSASTSLKKNIMVGTPVRSRIPPSTVFRRLKPFLFVLHRSSGSTKTRDGHACERQRSPQPKRGSEIKQLGEGFYVPRSDTGAPRPISNSVGHFRPSDLDLDWQAA